MKKTSRSVTTFIIFIAGIILASPTQAQIPPPENASDMLSEEYTGESYSPYAGRGFGTRPLWGDSHLHTGNSFDAGAFGARLRPEDAHRFARGDEVISSTGIPVRLSRPLDWLMVADHSDNMGFFLDLYAAEENILSVPKGKDWYDRIMAGKGPEVAYEMIGLFANGNFPENLMYWPNKEAYKDVWQRTIAAAEQYNDPGNYTAFIGYECTSLISGNNMHRVVIYRDDADKGSQMVPYTTYPPFGSPNPRDLWKWLANYEEKTGGDVLALAHNGNLANGIMFPLDAQFDGRKLDDEYITQRIKWEPLYEITQIKGDGETHPYLSPEDEFADYETWDIGNLDTVPTIKTNDMLAGEYAREALKNGLAIEARLGTNPYKFGVVGSTDSHTGLATAQEDNFFGKHSGAEPKPSRMTHPFLKNEKGTIMGWGMVSSGLAAVYAEENTRKSIFDAMERKEVYGTTETRITVRFLAAGNSPMQISTAGTRPLPATKKVCQWAATCRPARAPHRHPSWSSRSAIRLAATSTESRSSRAGWTTKAKRMSKFTTWFGQAIESQGRMASCLRWATRSPPRRPVSPIPSGCPSWPPCGPTRILTPARVHFITPA